MYILTFNTATMNDMLQNRYSGRQIYGAITLPYCGWFTSSYDRSSIVVPKLLCPYQVNDIVGIQELWARDSNSYVYRADLDDQEAQFYDFRPATTMPDSAIRMYARIVSIRTWSATPDILKHYMTLGSSADSAAGTAKVIGYYDKGNELLSKIRKIHNQKILNDSATRTYGDDPELVEYASYYYRRLSKIYTLSFTNEFGSYTGDSHLGTDPTLLAQSKGKLRVKKWNTSTQQYEVYNENDPSTWVYVDVHHNRELAGEWSTVILNYKPSSSAEDLRMREEDKLLYRGEAVDCTETNPRYIYVNLTNDLRPVPMYAYYITKVIDPELMWHVWLISAYLSDRDGNIIGNWFGGH